MDLLTDDACGVSHELLPVTCTSTGVQQDVAKPEKHATDCLKHLL